MLHEIVDAEDGEWVNADFLDNADGKEIEYNPEANEASVNEKDLLKPNQLLQVVKITKCKMKQRDTLELEIGLKSLESNNKAFEERKFVLRFLDKLSP